MNQKDPIQPRGQRWGQRPRAPDRFGTRSQILPPGQQRWGDGASCGGVPGPGRIQSPQTCGRLPVLLDRDSAEGRSIGAAVCQEEEGSRRGPFLLPHHPPSPYPSACPQARRRPRRSVGFGPGSFLPSWTLSSRASGTRLFLFYTKEEGASPGHTCSTVLSPWPGHTHVRPRKDESPEGEDKQRGSGWVYGTHMAPAGPSTMVCLPAPPASPVPCSLGGTPSAGLWGEGAAGAGTAQASRSVFIHTHPASQPGHYFENILIRGIWVAQLVEHLTFDFGSGHDLRVHGFKPRVGLCVDSSSACLGFCPSVSAPALLTHTLYLKIIK